MNTHHQQSTLGKIGLRLTSWWYINQPPLRWRRVLRGWAKFWLGVALGLVAVPVAIVVAHVMGVAK
jgi:hypothetical protein